MQSLKVNYPELFEGLDRKPDSYREIADQYEWTKRDSDKHVDQYRYDDFNTCYLKRILDGDSGKVVVECGCGPGGNLIPYTDKHTCIGLDYSRVALEKLRDHSSDVPVSLADVSAMPLRDESVDYMIFARVLFVHEDLDFIVEILQEARRVIKPQGRIIIVNDYSCFGVRALNGIGDLARRLSGRFAANGESMLYYFSLSDLRWLLQRAGLRVQGSELCNIHQGVYHLTYHSKLLGLLLRHNYYTARMTGKTPEFDDGNRVGYRYLGWSRPPQGAGAGAASLVYGRITEA